MAEPLLWQLLERIKENLEAIEGDDGDTYWYTPDEVVIVPHWDDTRLFDSTLSDETTIIAVRRSDRQAREETTGDNSVGGGLAAGVDVHILVSQRFNPSSPSDEPGHVQIVERLLADVTRAILLDPQLGGLADNVAFGDTGLDDTVEFFVDGWACGQLTLRLAYSYMSKTP